MVLEKKQSDFFFKFMKVVPFTIDSASISQNFDSNSVLRLYKQNKMGKCVEKSI